MSKQLLEDSVRQTLNQYFQDLQGTTPSGLHELIIGAVEKPLLDLVMQQAQGNQSRAAEWLGINRNTLRRKLLDHHIISS